MAGDFFDGFRPAGGDWLAIERRTAPSLSRKTLISLRIENDASKKFSLMGDGHRDAVTGEPVGIVDRPVEGIDDPDRLTLAELFANLGGVPSFATVFRSPSLP